MAKKKKTAAKKKGSTRTTATTPAYSAAELQAAAVVTWGAENLLGAVEYLGFDINAVVNEFPVTVQDVSASGSVSASGEGNARDGLELARRLFNRRDFCDKPYLTVFGRVMEILLNHRGYETCSAGDVFRVFLVEIPGQLEENHRQYPRTGQQVSASTGTGRRTFNNRMESMRQEELARPTRTRDSGQAEAYVLTEDGQALFDGWPDLADIPGLTYAGPVTPEERPRRRS